MNVSDSIQVPSGVLLIDKARDMTSHDVVAIARRSLGIKKIGHCGTLDPMATGLLMLVVGKGDNLQFPAFFFVKKLGYVEAKMGRIAISDDCQIFSRTAYAGFPERNLEILGDKGGGFYRVVERFRFQIERKAFRTHARPQQPGGIIRERGINNPGTGQ